MHNRIEKTLASADRVGEVASNDQCPASQDLAKSVAEYKRDWGILRRQQTVKEIHAETESLTKLTQSVEALIPLIHRLSEGKTTSLDGPATVNPELLRSLLQLPGTHLGSGDGILLSELIDQFVDEHSRNGCWRSKTKRENAAILDLFLRIVGDKQTHHITHDDIRKTKSAVLGLPPNINKMPKTKGKSIEEILEITEEDELMSHTTCKKYLSRMATFLKWAYCEQRIGQDFSALLNVRIGRRHARKRRSYSVEELTHLFSKEACVRRINYSPSRFWTPLLGLYTGARLNAICQLRCVDVLTVDEIRCLSFNEEGETHLKTESSERILPIHPDLIEFGFMNFVNEMRNERSSRLFPDFLIDEDGYCRVASRWFQRERTLCGIQPSEDTFKDFHTFRHTFSSRLAKMGVETEKHQGLLGHKTRSISIDRYSSGYGVDVLYEIVKDIDYGIDLSHLKNPEVNFYIE